MGWRYWCSVAASGRCAARRSARAAGRPRRLNTAADFRFGLEETHRSYVWAYATSQFCEAAAAVYDFSPSSAGEHARNFLNDWKGKLLCDDFGG
jgi:hypothetical protein